MFSRKASDKIVGRLSGHVKSSHDLVRLLPGPRGNKNGRPLKETLSSKYMHVVEPLLNQDGVMAEVSYKRALSTIHTSAVCDAINS